MDKFLQQLVEIGFAFRGGLLGMLLVEGLLITAVVLVWPRWLRERRHGRWIEALGFFVLVVTGLTIGALVFFVGGAALFDNLIDMYGAGSTLALIILLAAYQILAVAPAAWRRVRQGLLVVIAPLFVFFAIMAGMILGRILI